LAKKTNRTLKM